MTFRRPDPEFGDEAPADAPCDRCDDGWVRVTPAYAERIVPFPEVAPPTNDEEQAQQEALFAMLESKRAAAADSVFPCRVCRPHEFFRWAGGHYDRFHDHGRCAECMEKRKTRRAS